MSRRPALVVAVAALVMALLPAQVSAEPSSHDNGGWQVVGGEPAPSGAYPFMAALLLPDQGGFFQFCGGSLIAPEWVLSAAHCFFDSRTGGSGIPPEELLVVLGADDWTADGTEFGVDQIVLHPGYDEVRTVNDAVLLHLTAPSPAAPIRLAAPEDAGLYPTGASTRTIGYGAQSPDGSNPSTRLLQADVPVVDDPSCAQSYPGLDFPRHLCAGRPGPSPSEPGPDSCQGDSGGPLFADPDSAEPVLVGIVSFGGLCGVEHPGVYTEVVQYGEWATGIVSGTVQPTDPDPGGNADPDDAGADAEIFRIETGQPRTEPIAQAAMVSLQIFPEASATFAVLARADLYADALGGSALAYGVAPLLFTDATGLPEATANELMRAVQPGSPVYVLGGVNAVPPQVDDELRALGFTPERLAGLSREETARIVAEEVVSLIGGGALPLDSVIVATSANWPDAVTAGQISSWWGVPILLTPPDRLDTAPRQALEAFAPRTVYVVGGSAAISDAVFAEIQSVAPGANVVRLGGATRIETAARILEEQLELFHTLGGVPPAVGVVVNLRREDAFAHVLSGSMITGVGAGVYLPLEGEGGDRLDPLLATIACGIDKAVIVQGGTDLVAPEGAARVRQVLDGQDC